MTPLRSELEEILDKWAGDNASDPTYDRNKAISSLEALIEKREKARDIKFKIEVPSRLTYFQIIASDGVGNETRTPLFEIDRLPAELRGDTPDG